MLPDEIICTCITFLPQSVLYEFSQASRRFYALALPFLYEAPLLTSPEALSVFLQRGIVKHGRLVKVMDLSNLPHRWKFFTNLELEVLLASCPRLKVLDLNYTRITDPSFTLSLPSTTTTTPPPFAQTTTASTEKKEGLLPELKSLGLERVKSLTNTGILDFLQKYGTKLERLNLSFTKVSNQTLAKLSSICPGLVWLSLNGLPQLQDDTVAELVRSCKRLKYLLVHDINTIPSSPTYDADLLWWETEQEDGDDDDDETDDTDEEDDGDDDSENEGEEEGEEERVTGEEENNTPHEEDDWMDIDEDESWVTDEEVEGER